MIPSTWYKAIIRPILKKGKDPLFPLSHRGINLMSTIAKVFSSILNKRLTDFLETNRIYAEEQNGFRRLRSCLDHLYALTTVIRNRKLLKLDTYCAFVDFEKAFDSVEYPFLWYKMLASGIHGKMLKIIQTMYANLQNWFSQSAGVRQGDALAPTLFALFINDLVPEINALSCGVPMSDDKFPNILLYADDIVLISGTTEGLQKQLDGLNDWSSRWKLRVNTNKTNVAHFRRTSDTTTDHVFTLGNSPLHTESSYRYLGMDINDTLDFNHSVNVLSYSAGRALGAMTSKYYQADGLDYDTYTKMYESLVTPIMDYGCEIWGYKQRGRCDVVQHRALRTFLGVGKCTPLPTMYIDMAGTHPMCDNSLQWYAIGGDCVVCRATGSPRRSSSGTTIWQCIPGAGMSRKCSGVPLPHLKSSKPGLQYPRTSSNAQEVPCERSTFNGVTRIWHPSRG